MTVSAWGNGREAEAQRSAACGRGSCAGARQTVTPRHHRCAASVASGLLVWALLRLLRGHSCSHSSGVPC